MNNNRMMSYHILKIWRQFKKRPHKVFIRKDFRKIFGYDYQVLNKVLPLLEKMELIEKVILVVKEGRYYLAEVTTKAWKLKTKYQ